MIRTLLALFRPLTSIARELRIIRELYEADLDSRPNPIHRLTETPNKKDTEVLYAGQSNPRPGYKIWHGSSDEDSEPDSDV